MIAQSPIPPPPKADAGPNEPPRKGRPSKHLQILDTSRRLFLDQGYDASSMDAIAREAGVSKATLYAHFDSKEALFAALIKEECRAITDRIWPLDIDPADVEGTLRRVAENITAVFLDQRGLAIHRVIIAEAGKFPELGRIFWEAGPQTLNHRLGGFLREATARGLLDVADPELAAIQFLSLVRGDLPLLSVLSFDSLRVEAARLVEGAISLFMAGYAVRR
jgi:AcrR family transcriptional regulator